MKEFQTLKRVGITLAEKINVYHVEGEKVFYNVIDKHNQILTACHTCGISDIIPTEKHKNFIPASIGNLLKERIDQNV